ncbi:porin family protein [Nostoc sp. UHCC 0870]|uniref:porin family protein n=1 Tax=Nostoc sp. UHCC 0870 TaxID=2914041 RepID=UPI001EE11756|nr:porin family protein [Nostoc sp. UHCC 0870]UKO97292.1 porin family protein [Nostoc sp. UHCC 0870]
MKNILKSLVTISALSSVIMTAFVINSGQAAAETKKGTDASYVGAGVAAGVTEGGQTNDAPNFGGNLTGRVKLGNTPFSARGNVLWNDKTSAIIPELSFDVPIANRTNAFVTGGYSFVEKNGSPTPLGNRDAVVVGAGIESEVANNFLVYTNAKVGLRAYQNSPASAVSINGGIGYRFR